MSCSKHRCACAHERVRYCASCQVVHCLDCSQEWTPRGQWHSPYVWYSQQSTTENVHISPQITWTSGNVSHDVTTGYQITCKHGD